MAINYAPLPTDFGTACRESGQIPPGRLAVAARTGSRRRNLQSDLRNFLADQLCFPYTQTRFDAIEEVRERALVLWVPGANTGPQINGPPRRARLVVYRKVLFQAVAHHRRARRNGVHTENCKLRLSQPPHHIAPPAAP